MKNQRISLPWLPLLAVLVLLLAPVAGAEESDEKAKVEQVVLDAYVHGAFNEQNTEAMRSGFHPIFKIHGVREGELSTYPIDEWISGIEERKRSEGYERQTWEHRFPMTDITGGAAVVKVELYRVRGEERSLVFTDYLSLLKIDGAWKITDKVYHRHPSSR